MGLYPVTVGVSNLQIIGTCELITTDTPRITWWLWDFKWTFPIYRCPTRNVPDSGRMFLKLTYTDITKNTYIRSWTVTEIKTREIVVFLRFHVLYLVQMTYYTYTAHIRPSVNIRLKRFHAETAHVKCLEPQGQLRR